jgi:hypothetical protein
LGDRLIRWITALVVVVVALIAAYVSYHHAYELVSRHGESGATARVVPLTVDGLVLASSMVLLHSARHRTDRRQILLAWSFLALGILATRVRDSTSQYDVPTIAEPAIQTDHTTGPQSHPTHDPVLSTEYDEYAQYDQNEHENDDTENEILLAQARTAAEKYWTEHQTWITRDELRNQLRCSSERASELLRILKTETPDNHTT